MSQSSRAPQSESYLTTISLFCQLVTDQMQDLTDQMLDLKDQILTLRQQMQRFQRLEKLNHQITRLQQKIVENHATEQRIQQEIQKLRTKIGNH